MSLLAIWLWILIGLGLFWYGLVQALVWGLVQLAS